MAASIERVREELAGLHESGDLEIVVVDDGSADSTAVAARRAGADVVVENPRNRGKGASVKAGVAAARGKAIAFTDIDLAYAPTQLLELLAVIEAGAPMAVGSRWLDPTDADLSAPPSASASAGRAVASRLFNVATFASVGIWRDTQCGIKAFSRKAARELFARVSLDGFAFDVELFLAARAAGLEVVEVPVRLSEAEGSTIRVSSQLKVLVDLWRLRGRLRRGLYEPGRGGGDRS